jgi:uncharacterized FlaG/YvyC family protein
MEINNTPQIASTVESVAVSSIEAAHRRQVAAALRGLNQMNVFGASRELTFTFDRTSHQMIIRVIDRDTHELVMQLTPEYLLRLWANLQQGK